MSLYLFLEEVCTFCPSCVHLKKSSKKLDDFFCGSPRSDSFFTLKVVQLVTVKENNMTVYIDIILTENLIMNYIILYATGIIYKIKPKIWRLFCASLIGAMYAVVSYLKILNSGLILSIFSL